MLARPDNHLWLQAECREISGLIAKQVFRATWLPKGARMARCIWVYSYKLNEDGNISAYKAMLAPGGERSGQEWTTTKWGRQLASGHR